MNHLKEILEGVARGQVSVEEAENRLQAAEIGYAELAHTKLDLDRRRRRGVAEAIFCDGKTREQILEITVRLDTAGQSVLCTRVAPETAAFICAARPDFVYHPQARVIIKQNEPGEPGLGMILVVTAGTSDIPVAEEAALTAELLGNDVERVYDVGVAGLHRLLGAAGDKLREARVVIVAAGMEGALPSVVAGLVSAPVIGVPTSIGYGASFKGIAALLGMLNSCSGGLGIVNIDNGYGAALLAHMINRAPKLAQDADKK